MTIKETQATISALYVSRRDRLTHPDGETDSGGRWYPSEEERCDCCGSVREPSRTFPWSLSHHCRTKKHVQALLRKRGEI